MIPDQHQKVRRLVPIHGAGHFVQLRNQPRAAREDVLGPDLAVADGVELVDPVFRPSERFEHGVRAARERLRLPLRERWGER